MSEKETKKIKIILPKSLYNSLKNSLKAINEETKAEINSEMTFEEFFIFILENFIDKE